MTKRILSSLIAFSVLVCTLPPPSIGQQDKTKPASSQPSPETPKKEKKGLFDRAKDTTKKVGKAATDVITGKTTADPVALALGALFNDQLPLKLDVSSAYKEVPTPADFRPKALHPTPANINNPLLPGDYSVPVRATCTKDSIHVPGNGLAYKLAPLQGKHADALGALIMKGDLARVPHNTLQMVAWEIQASIPYGEMPKEHQALIDRFIPEYKNDLSGNFLQRITDAYDKAVREHPNAPIAGFGETLRSINRSRTIIREENFNYQRSQMHLYDPALGEPVTPADPSEPSPWTELQPGVYAQILIVDGWAGLNRLNLRITKEAGRSPSAGSTNRLVFLNTAYAPGQGAAVVVEGFTLAELFGLTARAGRVLRGLIAYGKAAQALIMAMSGDEGKDGGDDPDRKSRWEDNKKKATDKMKEWGEGKPSDEGKDGEGWKWEDPKNPKGNQVRIRKGDPNAKWESQREDYVQVRREGKVIGKDGNPIKEEPRVSTSDKPEAHISMREWLQWSSPLKP